MTAQDPGLTGDQISALETLAEFPNGAPKHHEAESRQPEASECRSGGIERCSFLAAPRSRQTRFLLAFPNVLFDQCRACGKDRGKCEKQAANDGAEAGGDEACNNGHRPAKRESDEILVPARLKKDGRLESNDHES
jgi:hypothetical protein